MCAAQWTCLTPGTASVAGYGARTICRVGGNAASADGQACLTIERPGTSVMRPSCSTTAAIAERRLTAGGRAHSAGGFRPLASLLAADPVGMLDFRRVLPRRPPPRQP